MGWKVTSIVIKNPGQVPDEQIINSLFDTNYKELPATSFEECVYPDKENTIYFGNYKDNLIISTYACELVDRFFTGKVSKAEEIFIGHFPNSEIGAFSLHSSVNHYAWTIISKGKKLRVKQGDADNGLSCDFGEPLPEEQEFIKQSFKDEDGNLSYRLKGKNGDEEEYTEDQIGENYVSKIWSRFTGIELFEDDSLNEVKFRGYELEMVEVPVVKEKNFFQRLFGK